MNRVTRLPPLPPRPIEGHKGMFGRVLIVGGNPQMIGAPVLAGTSALRSGAGLVQVAMPEQVLAHALSVTPELIGLGLGKNSRRQLSQAADAADALVIGPGLGQGPASASLLSQLIKMPKPVVIDADGLNWLASQKRWPTSFKAEAVLTPHPGEMKRLAALIGRHEVPTDEKGRIEIASEAARLFGQVLVLKGYRTVVTDGLDVYVNDTGDSSLSKAGTGDVLSGMIGCFVAQKMKRLDAAIAAVWIHGRAGELAGQDLGRRCVLALDVVKFISASIRQYEQASGADESR